MTRFAGLFMKMLAAMAVVFMTAWASLAAYWSDIHNPTLRTIFAAAIVLATVLTFACIRRKGVALVAYLAAWSLFTLWWSSIAPSGDRNWQQDVAVLPYAEISGDTVTVRNIRDFVYRSETEYQPRYYDKTFDLNKLDSVDLIAVYWMGDAIAHVMMSFGFAGQDYLCLSIETRKEQGEEYSSLKGFFKQYEQIYVAADERDVIRLRTDYRNPREDVYLYRTRMPPENARKLFLEYMKTINSLRDKPEFYNTLTTNCTTNVVRHFRAFGGRLRYNWKILLSGYMPLYAYEIGGLDDSLPFEELKARSYINPKAQAVGDAPDFSARIRD
ncbi:MAG: hypothetical protein B193_0174 [Solidesulfovibrio magneticus str. Maddingley MBC34]|uniref:Lnb N-terminal periplasmic domain-containing protein n=1 Tax=Solidesulfovibrio magneticus str. Maddingley MBC34 TaxID=1206767 RepID=K6GJ60_9BACT|nr:MAG: hypothetical protein B193_0174 [Solidesulfovibrio magneticus str. Maddingley MBC34]